MKRHIGTLLTVAAGLLTICMATPANAAGSNVIAPQSACSDGTPYYTLTATSYSIPFGGIPVFKNGPGPMTMTVSKAYSGTASYSVTAGVTTEVNAILAEAKVQVSATLTLSNPTTATNTATVNIPAGKYATLRYVSYGKKINWKKARLSGNCQSETVLATGTIIYPTSSECWNLTWSTS